MCCKLQWGVLIFFSFSGTPCLSRETCGGADGTGLTQCFYFGGPIVGVSVPGLCGMREGIVRVSVVRCCSRLGGPVLCARIQ